MGSDWINYLGHHFRPLSINVGVLYNTIIRSREMYFTRNRTLVAHQLRAITPFSTTLVLDDMAPRLSPAKLVLIRDMIESQPFTTSEMAEQAESNRLTIINICRNLRQFRSMYAP